MPIIYEISLLLGLAALVSIIMRALRQPLIVGYIITGILAGPYIFNLIHSSHQLELFSKIGIIFLLFIVGLHLNPKIVGEVGKVSLITGVGQILFTSLVGFIIALLLGIDRLAALYVAIALTFSSTIIILKLISDKGDLEKLYAKIAIGFLLVQDIAATLILIAVGILANAGAEQLWPVLLATLAKGVLVFFLLTLLSTRVLPRLVSYLAVSQELLFIFSAAYALGLASLLAAIGFSIEIGALVAGVSLAITPFADEMASRLKPVRDLFVLIFFILLGSQMALGNIGALLLPALLLSVFVLVGNPVIVVLLMNALGYSRKTGFMAGLTVAQISEFSLILAALGFQVGHLPAEILSLITLVGLITIAGSTYMILYADRLYPALSRVLSVFELINKKPNEADRDVKGAQIILFGYDRVGRDFVTAFKAMKKPYLVIDFNPDSIKRLEAEGVPCRFGDACDPDFLSELPFDQVKLCVSTIPEFSTNLMLQKYLNQISPRTITVLLAYDLIEAKQLYQYGTSYVLLPHYLGAKHAARLIGKYGLKAADYETAREKHLHELGSRNGLAF
jgi:Kef-type K+ transport system membrane component KefB